MLLFLSLTGIFLSMILLVFNARRFRSSWYLGGFFFIVSLYAFTQYLFVDSHSVLLLTIFFVHWGFLFYLIGPLLYWYVRSVLTDQTRFRARDMWHLVPALIFLGSTLPYILLPISEKEANAALLATDIVNLKYIRISLLSMFMHPAFIFISRPLLVLVYTVWSLALFIRWLRQRQNTTVLSQQRYMISWLPVLLGFLFILAISHMIAMMEAYLSHDLRVFFTLKLLHLFSGVGLTGLLISPLFFPSILYGLPQIPAISAGVSPSGPDPVPNPTPDVVSNQTPVLQVPKESPKPAFEDEYLNQIGNKLDDCMENLQPFLQHDCNLAYMAKLTGIPAHHLAYYFREEKQQPFTDYRNDWRVTHAKKLIREGKTKELTLEAIGLLSGFTTRNTFYTAFKKTEGISPSAFMEKEQGLDD